MENARREVDNNKNIDTIKIILICCGCIAALVVIVLVCVAAKCKG